jgi:hypothetical protein
METNPFSVNLCSAQNTRRWRKSIKPTIKTAVDTEILLSWWNKTDNVRVHINVTLRRVRVNTGAVEKQYYYMFWVRATSLSCPACTAHEPHSTLICGLSCSTIHAQHMNPILLSSVVCPVLPYMYTLSHIRQGIRYRVTEHKMCVLIFSTNSVCITSHYKKNSARHDHKFLWSSCEVPFFLVRF